MTKLKKIRLYKGLTQKEVAIIVGISERTLQAYEQGKRSIKKASIESILKLAELYEIDFKELIND